MKERLEFLNITVSKSKEFEIVVWCENINFKYSEPRIACPSGERTRARYSVNIIDEAIELVIQAGN